MLDEDTKKAWYEAGLIFGQGIAETQEKTAEEEDELDPTQITMDEVFAAIEESEEEEKIASEEDLDWSEVTLAEFIEAAQEVEEEDLEKEAAFKLPKSVKGLPASAKKFGRSIQKSFMKNKKSAGKAFNKKVKTSRGKAILALLGTMGVTGTGGYFAGKYKPNR